MLNWQGYIVPVSTELVPSELVFVFTRYQVSKNVDGRTTPTHLNLPNVLWNYGFSQDCAPYDKGAFRVELIFPSEYPFKPPKITFKTKIYHPNVDEKGQVCLPIISAENWKPATKTDQGKAEKSLQLGFAFNHRSKVS